MIRLPGYHANLQYFGSVGGQGVASALQEAVLIPGIYLNANLPPEEVLPLEEVLVVSEVAREVLIPNDLI